MISHFTERGYSIKGIVHVGAHAGQEIDLYRQMGLEHVVLFEPLPDIFEQLSSRSTGYQCVQLALSDRQGTSTFYRTADGANGQCSSLLQPLDSILHMTGGVRESITVETDRFDLWALNNNFKWTNYDCLVVDTQGSELQVLRGVGTYLPCFKYICVEASAVPLYEGGAPARQVSSLLETWGFTQTSPTAMHDDIHFIRSDILA